MGPDHFKPVPSAGPKERLVAVLFGWVPLLLLLTNVSQAQVTPPITSSGGLNTQVSAPTMLPSGQINYNITGGARPGNGANLFHSFGEFNVPTNNIANFLNETALPTTNILSRVTAGNPSSIFGTIQTEGFGSANLFLINPAGIIFGPNATLNVNGAFYTSTANYLRLSDNVRFNALPEPTQDALLSAAPVAAFGFLDSNPGAITIQGSNLQIPIAIDSETGQPKGSTLSLVGGDITVKADPETGTPVSVLAPSGQVNLVSVASPGEVLLASYRTGPNINGQSFGAMGTVRIIEGSTLDVSDNAFAGDGRGGIVRIRGGQFVMDNSSFIFANTIGDVDGAHTAVSVEVQGDVELLNGSVIMALPSGAGSTGRVGDVQITGENVKLDGSSLIVTGNDSAVGVPVTPDGSVLDFGGNIYINSKAISLVVGSVVFTNSGGTSNGGTITIQGVASPADSLSLSGFDAFGNPSSISALASASGNTGKIEITAGAVEIRDGGIIQTLAVASGSSGDVTLNVQNKLNITGGGLIGSFGGGNSSGNVTVTAGTIFVSGQSGELASRIENSGGVVTTGDINLNAKEVVVTDGARINSQSFQGQPGSIKISATESVTVSDGAKVRIQTLDEGGGLMEISAPTITMDQGILQTRTNGEGDAAAIKLVADDITLSGSQINSQTDPSIGRGGDVTINVTDKLVITGQFAGSSIDSAGPAGIFTTTFSGGDAGRVSVSAGTVEISGGGQINSSTFGSGNAGGISLQGTSSPAESILIDGAGSGIFTDTQGEGAGGNINLFAQSFTLQNGATLSAATSGTAASATGGTVLVNAIVQDGNIMPTPAQSVSLSNGASISASSSGPANAGEIVINAGNQFLSTGSVVTTGAKEASGGSIILKAADMVHLVNSEITTSVQGGTETRGGDITIDPQFVILQNSQILATATQGNGGDITITAGTFLADPASLVSASSQLGVSGTVNIQSPVQNFSSSLAPLPKNFQSAAALLAQRCAARAAGGQVSTFVMAGREGLPAEPGGFLTSPAYRTSATGVAGDEPLASASGLLVAMADREVSIRPGSAGDRFPVWDVGCRFEHAE
ncbi:MAG: filamentous hemagglutinin N-terminal domain-containing protein [Candidatus Methylomirabilis sp.]